MSHPTEAADSAHRRVSHRVEGPIRYFHDLDAVSRERIHDIVRKARYRSLVLYIPITAISPVNRYFSPRDDNKSKAYFSLLYLLLAQVVDRGSVPSAEDDANSVILLCQVCAFCLSCCKRAEWRCVGAKLNP
jgi:hypothetical protein